MLHAQKYKMLHAQKYNLSHLADFRTYVHGPIQDDEALFLYSLCKMIRPSTILEFGVLDGLSSLNFASAKDSSAHLYSFDRRDGCIQKARQKCHAFANCFFSVLDCTAFCHTHVANRQVDIFFLDCSHVLEKNQICIESVIPCMSDAGIIIIHDTGFYYKDTVPDWHVSFNRNFEDSDRMPVILAEQKTVDWMRESHSDWSQINFHSRNHFRHGMTFLQRSSFLSR